MGCWLGTDGITGASIIEGEECYALICSVVDGIYRPLFLPVLGKYNDYGSITDIVPNPFVHEEMLKYLKKLMHIGQIVRGPDSRFKFNNIDEFLRDAERGHLKWKDDHLPTEGEKIDLVLFSKDVFDKAVEMGKNVKWWDGKKISDRLRGNIKTVLVEIENIPDKDDFIRMWKFQDMVRDAFMKGYEWSHNIDDIVLSPDSSHSEKEGIMEEMFSFRCFLYFMEEMRLSIGFPVGKGSQSDNLESQAEFYKFAWKRSEIKAWENRCNIYRWDCEEGALFVGETEEV
jgi:hypothetical protein